MTCTKYHLQIIESGTLSNGRPRCGACAGCAQWLAASTCGCFSSWRLPSTIKRGNIRVCTRCGLRRRPAHQRSMYRQPIEDNAIIMELDDLGMLDQF
jgi:hypothetical protein